MATVPNSAETDGRTEQTQTTLACNSHTAEVSEDLIQPNPLLQQTYSRGE